MKNKIPLIIGGLVGAAATLVLILWLSLKDSGNEKAPLNQRPPRDGSKTTDMKANTQEQPSGTATPPKGKKPATPVTPTVNQVAVNVPKSTESPQTTNSPLATSSPETWNTKVEANILGNKFGWSRWVRDVLSYPSTTLKLTGDNLSISSTPEAITAFKQSLDFKRAGHKYTHFYSLPLNLDGGSLNNALSDFQNKARKLNPNIPANAYIPAAQLHFTICVVGNLTPQINTTRALEILKRFPLPSFTVHLNSLGHFEDPAHSAKVLYAKPRDTSQLDVLGRYFIKMARAIGITDALKVTWHCTLIKLDRNTPSFDATAIMSSLGNFDFGPVTVSEVHLSRMGAPSPTQFYTPVGTLRLQ